MEIGRGDGGGVGEVQDFDRAAAGGGDFPVGGVEGGEGRTRGEAEEGEMIGAGEEVGDEVVVGLAGMDVEEVVSGAAGQAVGAGAAVQCVVASPSAHLVVARIANDNVVARIAPNR